MDLFETQDACESNEAAGAGRFVRVVVERGISGEVGQDGLTYRGDGLTVGQWVRVPLGRKTVGGLVVACGGTELLEGFDPRKVKAVVSAGEASLPLGLVDLARWIARYYACPLGVVTKAMLPVAVKKSVGSRVRVLVRPVAGAEAQETPLTPTARLAWERLSAMDGSVFPMEARALARVAEVANVGPINRLIEAGLLERVERREIQSGVEGWMTRGGQPVVAPEPSDDQQLIIDGIKPDLGRASVHLLRGVTGSGKTEVYLRLIAQAIEQGMGAIVLVPEIALTPQTVRRFADRCGTDRVAVLHSKLTGAQRNRAWSMCASGEAQVLIGPRSAVLAPMPNLGLIVVDEEHDSSYKQDSSPRYHGRDVAVKRGFVEGAAVLLGSATPSLESWRNARDGRYRLWTLADRVSGGRLPTVRIVDLAEERRARARMGESRGATLDLIGPTLEGALRATLDRGSQAILLLNRRGEAGYVGCASAACGWTMRCDACDVLLSSHRLPTGASGRYLRCHHCQAAQRVPDRCPSCAKQMVLLNAGTQHVEMELERRLGLVPGDDFVRVDSDSMRSGQTYFDVLDRFRDGRTRVLLGTQMIAKGLDFPNVGFVGVLNADTALMLPDFRAGERTFQLVNQVAGRAGRGDVETHGEAIVLVQSMYPDDPAITLAAEHDFIRFADMEMKAREAAKLPPAVRMARIVVRDASHARATTLAKDAASRLRERAQRGVRIDGPDPCTLARIADRYRMEVRVFAERAVDLMATLESLRDVDSVTSDATYAIDVDPVSVL